MSRFSPSDNDPVIVSSCRTPIGRLGGGLATVRADDMLALALNEAVARAGVSKDVDEVFAGCASKAGDDNRNVARMATVLAGFPYHVPGVTVNRLCASGLEAVVQAARSIKLGDYQMTLAGGVENMSRAPWVMEKACQSFPVGNPKIFDTSLGWRFPNPKMAALFPLEAMGCTAENLVDQHNISREDQDAFAVNNSHQKALAAQANGAFDEEIFGIHSPTQG